MTTKPRKNAKYDLMADIKALGRAIFQAADDAVLAHHLTNNDEISIVPHEGEGFHAADVVMRFRTEFGIEYELTTVATEPSLSWPIDTPAHGERIAGRFLQHMEYITGRAASVANSRKEILAAADELFERAAADGIELEVMRIQPAPVNIFGAPDSDAGSAQVFYVDVQVFMRHDCQGEVTEGTWTIDTDGPADLIDKVSNRILPDLGAVRMGFPESPSAS